MRNIFFPHYLSGEPIKLTKDSNIELSVQNYLYKQIRPPIIIGGLICDPDRIQTCNLLIRSQMLYSVEPRDHFLNAMQRYAYFLIQQNFSVSF